MSGSIPNNTDKFIQKLHALPVTQLYKLDAILSDLANHIHDIDEYTTELQETSKNYNQKQKEKILNEASTVEKQLISLSEILYKMLYDSHYMDRVQSILRTTFVELKELVKELKANK